MVIHGEKVRRPTKRELSWDIADTLGFERPGVSAGATVDSVVLDRIHRALTGGDSGGTDTYRKTERVMQALGLTYDPDWDTSEGAPNGGGTVTARAFSRIRSAVTGVPRCFLINDNKSLPNPDGEGTYSYTGKRGTKNPLNDAGPGSRVLVFSDVSDPLLKSAPGRQARFHGEVHTIERDWTPPWWARIRFGRLATPIGLSDIRISGWDSTDRLVEVTWETYCAALRAGGIDPDTAIRLGEDDPGGDATAKKVVRNFPIQVMPNIDIPDGLPKSVPDAKAPIAASYSTTGESDSVAGPKSFSARTANERKRDKLAEERAIDLVKSAFAARGWLLDRDCQADGVGYDLRYVQGSRTLKVEVKGVQGRELQFNLTPKEFWRAETDENFVVVAVTSVLSPRDYELHFVTRDRIMTSNRTITGFRITI